MLIGDPLWADWSQRQLDAGAALGPLLINAIVFAARAARDGGVESLDATIAEANLTMDEIPCAGLFLAGDAFRRYRASGGTRTGILPDIFIGAHVAILGVPLLTRKPTRYRTYFPTVTLNTPEALS